MIFLFDSDCDSNWSLLPTLVNACSVLSGALRYAWLISLRGRGMYCKVKLLRKGKEEEEERTEEGSRYCRRLKRDYKVGYRFKG